MVTQRTRVFVSDFETTSYEGQSKTEVWAAAIVELNTEDVQIFSSINELAEYILSFDFNSIIYYHNLKFDGEFWLNFLLNDSRFKCCFIQSKENINKTEKGDANGKFVDRKYMKSGEFRYSISDKGQWYSILIKWGNHYIELRDSLKLLPTGVKKLGESFGTKHKKTSIEYRGYRYAGGVITDEEKEYIANDVLVVKEALEIMYSQGHKGLTIGACCLQEYKATSIFYDLDKSLPNLYAVPIDKATFGSSTMGDYIRSSYRGGWCYVVDGKQEITYHNGTTADVNSLYPSMMHSESGNRFPIGEPTFWIGNYIPDEALKDDSYYFIRIKTQFEIKPLHLPCIQIKNSVFYKSNEWLKTSHIKSRIDGEYHDTFKDLDGNTQKASVILTLTMTDFNLIRDHYYLYNTEILDGCYFRAVTGLFDEYIDKYKKIKVESKGAVREIAKLFLNNLYGKMATSTDSSFKVAFLKPDNSVGYYSVVENEKKPGYIPIGSAITSYARNFTIRAAQKNYYGIDKPGFIYADTDSIHCNLLPEQIKGIKVDNNAFCCWKLESCWDTAKFIRQKTYAEHITHENLKPILLPHWDIKCAGMPESCKELFLISTNAYTADIIQDKDVFNLIKDDFTPDDFDFLSQTRTIDDFKVGLKVPGKLMPKHISGGIVLEPDYYTMKKQVFFT
jgi:hypothetical protein